MANRGDVTVRISYETFDVVKQAFLTSIEQVFEADIKSEAIELSPVDTSRNKNSIDTEVSAQENGFLALIFTQSGYGGYLELGHRVRGDSGNMVEGRPYLYPAFMHNLPRLFELCRENIQATTYGVETVRV